MKRGGPTHPKVLHFASMLGIRRYQAVGLLEMMWHFTASYAVRGDIGKHSDAAIVAAMDWPQKRGPDLIQALLACGFLERHEEYRLIVHGWDKHADGTCDTYLARNGLTYATGATPKRKRVGACSDKSGQVGTSRDGDGTSSVSRARVPLPQPQPQPQPHPCEREGGPSESDRAEYEGKPLWTLFVALKGERGFSAMRFVHFRDECRPYEEILLSDPDLSDPESVPSILVRRAGMMEHPIGTPQAWLARTLAGLCCDEKKDGAKAPYDEGSGMRHRQLL